jgi:branched-chain amino acid transport system ATP-binding protein
MMTVPPILEVSNVSVWFGGHRALNDVSLQASAGVITGLIGPNGAGKTTLFDVITGLRSPDEGTVSIEGEKVDHLPPYARARLGLARTFQRLELFSSLTVAENLSVAVNARAPVHGRRTRRQSAQVELIERFGLDDVADARADTLSTGWVRTVDLARAVATQPNVLLLDEPASGQDEHQTRRFAGIVRNLARDGMAVLLVEHDMDLVMDVCDTLYVLDFGTVIASGPPDQVRNDEKVVAAYLGAGR